MSGRTTIYCGDAIEELQRIESGTVDCCVTSPPYYGLRDYGVQGQIGMENTPEEYINRLVDVFREVRRVLKDDGTLWVNIGDSYASDRGGTHQPAETIAGGEHGFTKNGSRVNRGRSDMYSPTRNARAIGLKDKDMIGIPWMLAFALREDGWYLRQDIIWHKPNPMPESVKDRCTKSHEYIFLLSKSKRYYFDSEAIREKAVSTDPRPSALVRAREKEYATKDRVNPDAYRKKGTKFGGVKYGDNAAQEFRTKSGKEYTPTRKRNKRDVWTVTTKPFKGAHFAVFPKDLIMPCIAAGSRKDGIVLDPFAGSGTTGVVSYEMGRRFIGIELNEEYCRLSEDRINGAQMRIEALGLA